MGQLAVSQPDATYSQYRWLTRRRLMTLACRDDAGPRDVEISRIAIARMRWKRKERRHSRFGPMIDYIATGAIAAFPLPLLTCAAPPARSITRPADER